MAFDLCWKKSSKLSRSNSYIVPSWFWASFIGPVEFINEHDNLGSQNGKPSIMARAIFHGSHMENHGSDLYDQIESAWIKLEAPIATLKSEKQDRLRVPSMDLQTEQLQLSFDLDIGSRENLSLLFLLRRDDISISPWPTSIKNPVIDTILFGLVVRPDLLTEDSHILSGFKVESKSTKELDLFRGSLQ